MDRHGQRSGTGMVRRLAVVLGSAALLLPLAEPLGQRSGIVARTLLAMAATAMATPAQAQTVETLVTNSSETLSTSSSNFQAQAFTTGAAAAGYTVTSVKVTLPTVVNTSISVVIRQDNSGEPGDLVANLTNPDTLQSGLNTFTAPANTALAANTTYWLSFHEGVSSRIFLQRTAGLGETGLTGWTIADNLLTRSQETNDWSDISNSALIITIDGYANTPPNNVPTVATEIPDQTATVGTSFDFAFPDTTFNDADGDTLTYTAMLLENGVEIDLPSWLTFTPASRSFSGTPTSGGAITVRVTASDGTDTVHDDFDIKVGTACAAANLGGRRLVHSLEFMVGSGTAGGRMIHGVSGSIGEITDGSPTFRIRENDDDFNVTEVATESAPTAGQLTFSLSTDLEMAQRNALRLHVCGNSTGLDFSSATRTTSELDVVGVITITGYNYQWPSANLDWSGETTRTVHLSLPVNNPATGDPTITTTGTGILGDNLTADISSITDADGLPDTFEYQWVRENGDGTNREIIMGETSDTYRLTFDDFGKKVRVQVAFEDLLGGDEMRTSAAFPATDTVTGDPALLDVDVTSTPLQNPDSLSEPDTYGAREHIEFTARFNTPVEVSGVPTFAFDLGGTDTVAHYYRGSGTTELVFSYAVRGGATTGDEDTDGITWAANNLSGTIYAEGTTDTPALTHDAQSTALAGHKVDGTDTTNQYATATVTAITVTSIPKLMEPGTTLINTYGAGEDILIRVTFSEAVAVEGNPKFRFQMGDSGETAAAVDADYDPGRSTSTRLVFAYTVQTGDSDDNFIAIGQYSSTNPDTFQLASDDRIRVAANNVDADLSHSSQGDQTGHRVDGSQSANSSATGAPAITGTPQVGQTLTAGLGTIADTDGLPATFPDGYAFQWIRVDGSDETNIPGATQSTYMPVAADVGKTLKVRVSFEDDAGFDEARTSTATAAVTAAPGTCPEPTFETRRLIWSAELTPEQTEQVETWGYHILNPPSKGSLSPSAFSIGPTSFTFWTLAAETDTQLLIVLNPALNTEQKNALRLHVCDVTFDFDTATTDPEQDSFYAISASDVNWSDGAVRNVHLSLPANNAVAGDAPTISGTAMVGQELTVDASGITDADGLPPSFTYQWVRENEDGTGRETIAGATGDNYTLVPADAGKKVLVEVAFTDLLGGMESVESNPFPASGTVAVSLPAVSIQAVDDKAMQDVLPARFQVSVSEAPAADLVVNLAFSQASAGVPIIPPSIDATVTIPVNQTSAEKDFEVNSFDADVMLTATVAAGEGYANAPAPANAATVEVVSQSALTVRWAADDYTVEEGEDASPVLQFALPTGFPMPRGPSPQISVVAQSDTASSGDDYPATLASRTVQLAVTDWNDDDNDTAYTGTLSVEAPTVEDNIHEPEEHFFLEAGPAPGTGTTIACAARQSNGSCRTTITITDDDPNALPTSEDGEVMTNEDTAYGFIIGDFSFMDADTMHSNTLQSVTVATLPAADKGVLRLDDTAVTQGQQIPRAALEASPSRFTYTPPDDENGDDFASFMFRVSDGTDDSAAATTMTIDVIAVADAPRVVNPIPDRSAAVDVPFSYQVPADAFIDVDGDTLTYTAMLAGGGTLPTWLTFTADTLTFSGTPMTAHLGAITVEVTASDGTLSQSDDFVLTVRAEANALPTAQDSMVTATEDTPYTFMAEDFNFTDADATDTLASVRVISLETAGDLQLDGSAVIANQVISKADIDMDRLTFRPAENANGTGYATFTFRVSDGTDENPLAYTMTIDVDPVNDAPTVANPIPNQTTTVGQSFRFMFPENAFEDVDNDPLTYTAMRADGGTLPSWLTFAADTRTFSGTPTLDETLMVRVTASDSTDSVHNDFNIVVSPAVDHTAPRVESIERQNPGASPTNADSLTWRVTFSEAVTNVDAAAFMVSGSTATVTGVQAVSGETGVYDVTVSGGDLAGLDGTVTLGFATGRNIADTAGNDLADTAPTGTNDNSYAVDNTAPTGTNDNSHEVDDTAPTVGIDVPATSDGPFTAAITFNEVVSGFTVADITVSNGTLSDFTGSTTGTAWTVLVTPEMDGEVTLAIAANVAEDAAGNGNTAAPQASSTYTAPDTTAPTVGIDVPATSSAPFTATITFSEVVSGFTVADITVSNGTLSDFTGSTTGTVWTVLVTPEMDGEVTLAIAADVAMDAAGNGNTAAPQASSTYTAPDTTAPTVGIDVPATSSAPFTATITFSEVVSGFTVADITVSNGTLSDFTGSTTGTVWTVLVTPEMDGEVTLAIAADVAEDAAGNGNTAAPQVSSTYTAPAMDTEAKEEAEAVLDEVVLPEVMQQLTAQTTEVITSRLNTIASGSLGDPLTLSLDEVVADTVAFLHGQREHLKNGSLEWRRAFSGRSFAFPLSGLNLAQGESASAQEHPFSSLAVWGGADYSSYGNIIERTDVDGSGFSGVIGMDLQPTPRLVTGLALTATRWGLDYTTDANGARAEGTYEIGVTMLNPYVNWWATDQLSLWATFGYGRGAVDHNPEGDAATTRTDGLTSWAGGARFEVVPGTDPRTGEGSPFGLALKADGAASSFLDTQVQLVRLAAEVSRSLPVETGLLTAALDLGWSIRSVSDKENPDAQQQAVADKNDGGGAELASRLHWLNADGRLSATVDTRVLLGGGHHREWGIGGHLRFAPSRRAGEGLSLTLQPSFGVTGTRLDELWSLSGDGDPVMDNDLPGARLDAELAYGFPLGNALLTPYTEVVLEEGASTGGAGLRYHLNTSLELDLKGAHRSGANGNNESRLLLEVRSDL